MLSGVFMNVFGRPSLVDPNDIWSLMVILCLGVASSIWLEQKYEWASKISGAIIALIMAMVLANLGIIPTSCPLYDDIVWGVVIPMGIPLLLLQCNLKKIWRDTGRMLIIFCFGAVGTVVGGLLGYFLLAEPFGDASGLAKVVAMMTGSYIGGGVNFAAMASQFDGGHLTASATVADNMLMAIYFFVLIACAGMNFFRKRYSHPLIDEVERGGADIEEAKTLAAAFWQRKTISLKDIAFNFAYCILVVWLAKMIAAFFGAVIPADGAVLKIINTFMGSQYVWITTVSMAVATIFDEKIEAMHGSQEIGTYLIYLFLFVIGVPANIYTVVTEAPLLLVLTLIMVAVNMLFCFGGAKICKFDLEEGIIASNANIGGPTTAAGMAISQGWSKLVGPAMLIGTFGYVIGNYAGTIIGNILLGM